MEETITTTQLREGLTRHLEDVQAGNVIFRITHYNRPAGVIIPPDMYARLVAQHGPSEEW